jgi:hypothetical protein
MPFHHQVNPEHRLGVIWIYGLVMGHDIVGAHDALFLDKNWQPGFRVLWDAREIKELHLDPLDVEQFSMVVEKLKPRIGDARVAVVTKRETDHFVAAMLTTKSSRILEDEQKVFFTLKTAADWLGVPLEIIQWSAPVGQ